MLFANNETYLVDNRIKHKVKNFKISETIEFDVEKTNQLYLHCRYFFPIMEKYGFDYFSVGGTLLGAMRHQGLIPWDVDIDVAINKKTFDAIQLKIDELNAINPDYIWLATDPGVKVYYKKMAVVDVFTVDHLDDMMVYSAPYIDNKPTFEVFTYCFPHLKFKAKDCFPTKKMKFEDLTIHVPKNAKNILYCNYCEGCLVEVMGPSKEHMTTIHNNIFDTLEMGRFYFYKNNVIRTKYPNIFQLYLFTMLQKFEKGFKKYNNKETTAKPQYSKRLVLKELPFCIKDISNELSKKMVLQLLMQGL